MGKQTRLARLHDNINFTIRPILALLSNAKKIRVQVVAKEELGRAFKIHHESWHGKVIKRIHEP